MPPMYETSLTLRCVNCGFFTSSRVCIPDEMRTIRPLYPPPGWLLGSGNPHLCPKCNNEETLRALGVVPDFIERPPPSPRSEDLSIPGEW